MKMDHSNLKNFPAGFVLELWWMAMVNETLLSFKITHIHKDIYHQNFEYFWTNSRKLGIILLIASSFTADGSWTWWKSGQAAKQKHPFPWKEAKRYHINLIWITPRYSQSSYVISIEEGNWQKIKNQIVSVAALWKVSLTMCGTNA